MKFRSMETVEYGMKSQTNNHVSHCKCNYRQLAILLQDRSSRWKGGNQLSNHAKRNTGRTYRYNVLLQTNFFGKYWESTISQTAEKEAAKKRQKVAEMVAAAMKKHTAVKKDCIGLFWQSSNSNTIHNQVNNESLQSILASC